MTMASVCRRESLCLIVPDSQSQEVRHVSSYKFDGRQRLSQYLPVPESLPENYLLCVWCRDLEFQPVAKVWVSREIDGFKETQSLYGASAVVCDSQPGDPDFGWRQTESVTPNSPTRRTIDCERIWMQQGKASFSSNFRAFLQCRTAKTASPVHAHHDQKAGAIYVT